jgi:hypothetical protein
MECVIQNIPWGTKKKEPIRIILIRNLFSRLPVLIVECRTSKQHLLLRPLCQFPTHSCRKKGVRCEECGILSLETSRELEVWSFPCNEQSVTASHCVYGLICAGEVSLYILHAVKMTHDYSYDIIIIIFIGNHHSFQYYGCWDLLQILKNIILPLFQRSSQTFPFGLIF